MPYGYLITAVLAALCTVVAITAPKRPFALGLLSLFLGVVYNEAPIAVIVVLALSAVSSVNQPGMGSAVGWAGTGLLLLTLVGLVALALRGLRTDVVVKRALNEGLGTGWREQTDPALTPKAKRHTWVRLFAFPWVFGRRGVKRTANLSYGDAGMRNRLDVYRNASGPPGGPVLIHLHGGALMRGRKNIEARSMLYRLASEGWVCVSANYRLTPAVGFPEHLIDVKKVIAWVREHGAEYGADVSALFLAGTSAGGQLAALAGFTQNEAAYQPGFEDADTSVSAVIYLSGYYGDPDGPPSPYSPFAYARGAASAVTSPGARTPPFLIAHGTHDTLVPIKDARRFAEELRGTSSSPVVFAELPGGQHSFDRFDSPRFNAVVDGVQGFAAWVLSKGRAG
jgi:acetyl esterase/lipase